MDTGIVIVIGLIIAYPFIVSLVRALTRTTLNKTMPKQYCVKYKDCNGNAAELVFSSRDVNQVTMALRTIEEASKATKDAAMDNSHQHRTVGGR